MGIQLNDIIDLDYFIEKDEALDSEEQIRLRAVRDRRIYMAVKDRCQTDADLFISWLGYRRQQFLQDADKKGLSRLPGDIFSSVYAGLVYTMIFLGSITGISLAYSFLAYHGTRPINVAVFISLFIVLQVILILITLTLLFRKAMARRDTRFKSSLAHSLLSSLFFNMLPGLLKKVQWGVFKKSLDALEYTAALIRMKNQAYQALFFWPVYMLSAVFAFCFSVGVLGGTFFRVIVSDLAFGWQSTLMATSHKVYDLICLMALPWSWLLPPSVAHPSLAQIEGTRMVLKDGISILATQDLVSWWPFLCMGVLVYAVIPRGLLLISGILAQRRILSRFDFKRPVFRQLLLRMTSPVLDIDPGNGPDTGLPYESPLGDSPQTTADPVPGSLPVPDTALPGAVLLVSKSVYPESAQKKLRDFIQEKLSLCAKKSLDICFDFETDEAAVRALSLMETESVILVHEVWQPPIRGLLHYFRQIKSALPGTCTVWILLTREAGQEDLGVDETDLDLDVWKKAVVKLADPGIRIKRFF